MASFSVLTGFCIIKTSQVKEKRKEENRVKKTEDNSFSLPSHFWSIFRSPFSICYIPFQRAGSQESNASNRVRFGAKMRKIWPSEDNSPSKCEFCTTAQACANFAQPTMHVQISHQPMRLWCEISSVLPTPHEIFSFEDNAQLGWGV